MEDLVSWLEIELREGGNHPLLVIGGFLLAFLAASPFAMANGRTARVMVQGLLRRAGYHYVDYASLDGVVEEARSGWFDGLGASGTQLWMGGANTEPWLAYFLDLLRRQADRAVEAISTERSVLEFTRLQRSILEVVREHGTVAAGLLMSCTGANRNTLKDNLRRLVERGMLERMGSRRGTRYRLPSAAAASEPTVH
jgi:Fic family protein